MHKTLGRQKVNAMVRDYMSVLGIMEMILYAHDAEIMPATLAAVMRHDKKDHLEKLKTKAGRIWGERLKGVQLGKPGSHAMNRLSLMRSSLNTYDSINENSARGWCDTLCSNNWVQQRSELISSMVASHGNFANGIIFRHINMQGRKVSVINPIFKPDSKPHTEIKKFHKSVADGMYDVYDYLFLSDNDEYKKCVKGFVKGSGYTDHAKAHLGSNAMITVDISKFYQSISLSSIMMNRLFYRAMVTSFESRTGLEFKPETFRRDCDYVALNNLFKSMNVTFMSMMSGLTHNGILPTGAPYSPVISNLLLATLDQEFIEYSKKNDINYTRYADDICISHTTGYNDDRSFRLTINNVVDMEKLVKDKGFHLNYDKTKIMGPRDRKKIAGLIIDQSGHLNKLSIGTKYKLELRKKYEGKDWKDLSPSDHGLVEWVRSINYSQYLFIVESIEGSIVRGPLAEGRSTQAQTISGREKRCMKRYGYEVKKLIDYRLTRLSENSGCSSSIMASADRKTYTPYKIIRPSFLPENINYSDSSLSAKDLNHLFNKKQTECTEYIGQGSVSSVGLDFLEDIPF